jgi:UDP-N-acetylmuramoylalanine-D-glutamate ligase
VRELGARDALQGARHHRHQRQDHHDRADRRTCRAAGKVTAVAGNISPAALSALMTCLDAGKLPDIWVLELSSFQLETTASLAADAAAVLNVSDDHLDRYAGLDDYADQGAHLFRRRGPRVLNRQDASVMRHGACRPRVWSASASMRRPAARISASARVAVNLAGTGRSPACCP